MAKMKQENLLKKGRNSILLLVFLGCALMLGCQPRNPVSVLVVTGGHAYDTVNFLRMFSGMESIEYDTLIQPSANQLYLSEDIEKYDALVFYDMFNEITDEQKEGFLALLDRGVGVVFMHHCLASYQDWDEYTEILGGRYDLAESGYSHHQKVSVEMVNERSSITKDIEPFTLLDETYFDIEVLDRVEPLLSTNHPESDGLIGWTNNYSKSRIVYLQPGHDNNTYSNLSFRQLLENSIAWVSK